MRTIILIMMTIAIIITFDSCKSSKLFNRYLSGIMSDTNVYEIPALKIIDKNIYPILDSAIFYTEKCEYFDIRLPYLYAFYIVQNKDKSNYVIYAHKSIQEATGVFSHIHLNIPITRGVFYYKNYLFSIDIDAYPTKKTINYPFCVKAGYNYKVVANELFDEKSYSSYLDFKKENDKYILIENNICGSEIIIR